MVLHKIKGICSYSLRFYETKALIEIFILHSCVNISWVLGLPNKMFDKTWELYILVKSRLMRQELFSPLHGILYIRIINWNRARKLWMSHLNISFADRGMMPSSLFRDSESISISKSWLPSMVCVLPDPVCPYAMMHTLYLFSEHTISSIKCSKIHTASSACLNDNKHYWLHIEDNYSS